MASRYFVNGGVDNNWGTTGNWSLTDGGAGGETVPTASDDVFFTANSPACTVDTSARVALTLNFTGYTNTITMTNQITVSGSITLVAAMTIAGTGALICNATATLTSNGKTWPNAFQFTATATYTLADNWDINGTVTFGTASTTKTINGFQINAGAGLTVTGSGSTVQGTTIINLDGTGTVSSTSSAFAGFAISITINTAGTITFSGTNIHVTGTSTWTYTAGTVVTTGTTLLWASSGTWTLNTNGITWVSIRTQGGIISLTSDFSYTGNWLLDNTTVVNSNNIYHTGASGGLSGGPSYSGTSVHNFTGTGTISGLNVAGKPFVINTAGTYTISGANTFYGSFTHTAGTVVTTGSTLSLVSATTLNTSGITWNNVTILANTATHTLTSALNVSGTLTFNGTAASYTFNGSQINATGNITISNTTGNVLGTSVFNISGSSQTVASAMTSGRWSNNITIASTGTVFFTTGIKYSGVMTHQSGKVLGLIDIDYPPVPSSAIFDGSNEYVSVAHPAFNFERTDTWSIASWFKTNSATTNQALIAKRAGTPGFRGWLFNPSYPISSNLRLQFQLISDNATNNRIVGAGNSNLAVNVWYRAVWTYDGSSTAAGNKIYLNGVEESYTITTDALSATIQNTENTVIGGIGTLFMNGNIGWTTLWNTNLSAAQALADYNGGQAITETANLPASGNVVSHFNLGLGDTFPTATDSVGGNNGTYTNMEASDILIINRTISSTF